MRSNKKEPKTFLSSKNDSTLSDKPREKPDWGQGKGKNYEWIPGYKGKGNGKDDKSKNQTKGKGQGDWKKKSKKDKKRKNRSNSD